MAQRDLLRSKCAHSLALLQLCCSTALHLWLLCYAIGAHTHTCMLATHRCRFQRWGPTAPSDLTFTYNLVRAGSDIKLYYLGKQDALRKLVYEQSGLVNLPGAVYRSVECDVLGSRGWLAGSGWDPLECKSANVAVPQRVTPNGLLMKDREASK